MLEIKQIQNQTFDDDRKAVRIIAADEWDAMSLARPNSVTEVYTFTVAGINPRTVTIIYEDSTKEVILSVVKAVL